MTTDLLRAPSPTESWVSDMQAGSTTSSSVASGLTEAMADSAAFRIQQSFRDHRAKLGKYSENAMPPEVSATELASATGRTSWQDSVMSLIAIATAATLLFLFQLNTDVYYTPRTLLLGPPEPIVTMPLALRASNTVTVPGALVLHAPPAGAADTGSSSGIYAVLGAWALIAAINAITRADNVHVPKAEKSTRATRAVRVNAAGRPIYDDGKFMSFDEARRRGWVPLPSPATLAAEAAETAGPGSSVLAVQPWNAFQRSVGGCNLTKANVSTLYAKLGAESAGGDAVGKLRAAAATWNGFQHELRGCTLTKKQMSDLYKKAKGARGGH